MSIADLEAAVIRVLRDTNAECLPVHQIAREMGSNLPPRRVVGSEFADEIEEVLVGLQAAGRVTMEIKAYNISHEFRNLGCWALLDSP